MRYDLLPAYKECIYRIQKKKEVKKDIRGEDKRGIITTYPLSLSQL